MAKLRDIPYNETYQMCPYWHQTPSTASGSMYFVTSMPMQNAWENHIIAEKLGRHSLQRIEHFKTYEPGWDFGTGQAMSEKGLNGLCSFIQIYDLPQASKPSVFLTGDGHLELAWKDLQGNRCQAEFGPKKVGYYREDTGDEGEKEISEIPVVAELLSA